MCKAACFFFLRVLHFSSFHSQTPCHSSCCNFLRYAGPGVITAAADVEDKLVPQAAASFLVAVTEPLVLEKDDCRLAELQDEEVYGAAPLTAGTFWNNDRGLALSELDPVTAAGRETDLQEDLGCWTRFFLVLAAALPKSGLARSPLLGNVVGFSQPLDLPGRG